MTVLHGLRKGKSSGHNIISINVVNCPTTNMFLLFSLFIIVLYTYKENLYYKNLFLYKLPYDLNITSIYNRFFNSMF